MSATPNSKLKTPTITSSVNNLGRRRSFSEYRGNNGNADGTDTINNTLNITNNKGLISNGLSKFTPTKLVRLFFFH